MQNTGNVKEGVQSILNRQLFRCLCAFVLSLVLVSVYLSPCFSDQRKAAIIHIDHRLATEIVPVIQGLLSPEGTVCADTRTNSVVVFDTPQSVQQIRDFLEGFDYPVEQVNVRVRFTDNRAKHHSSVTADGKISGDDWDMTAGHDDGVRNSDGGLEISTGDREDDRVSVRLEGEQRERQKTSEYFITVSSGSPAYIVAGTTIPYRQKWINLCRRHGHIVETTEFRDVETGFDIAPVIAGDQAHIEITPRLSYLDPEKGEGIVRFTEASTFVTVLLNQWVSIGGAIEDDNEVAREILGYGSGSSSSDFGISMMVEKKK